MNKYLIVFFCCTVLSAQESDRLLKGKVKDAHGNGLPYATVRIEYTGFGTISDGSGYYEIIVPYDTCRIIYSYIGYQSQSIQVVRGENRSLEITLRQSDVELAEVIIGGEDPAFAIIREAIEFKHKRRRSMEDYDAKIYIKESFGTDSLLSVISEAYCRVRTQRNDSLQEEVFWRRQSSNLPEEIQFALVRDYLNFYDDTIKYMGHSFVGPLADNAFQYYDYRFIRSTTVNQQIYYDIELIPLSEVRPLFRGNIIISDSGFHLHSINVSTNSMFQIPLLTIDSMEISQQFSLYQAKYWMPLAYHVNAKVRYRFFSLVYSLPLNYRKSVISYEYGFTSSRDNTLPVLRKELSVLASKDDLKENGGNPIVYPLTSLEISSYKKIDDLVQQHPAAFGLPKYLRMIERWTRNVDIRYDRVEGLFVGGKIEGEVFPGLYPSAKVGYGFADRMIKYVITPTFKANADGPIAFGCEYHRWIGTFPVNYRMDPLTNTITAFFDGEDYFNYYLFQGPRVFVSMKLPEKSVIQASVSNDIHTSASKNTDFALNSIFESFKFRNNPPIREGRYLSAVIELFKTREQDTTGFEEPKDSWSIRFERSRDDHKRYFTSVFADAEFRISTMGRSRLLNPYLGITFAAGFSKGDLPPQKFFGLNAPLSGISFPSSFRTLRPGEFTGSRMVALSIEHNFRNIPFVFLGLSSLPLDIITRAAFGDISHSMNAPREGMFGSPLRKYWEYTIGIGRIADIFRVDISYAQFPGPRYVLTLTNFL